MSFANESQKPRSEKVLLSTIVGVERAKTFQLDTGSTYKKSVNHYVSSVSDGTTPLTSSSLPLSAGQYYYDSTNGVLYVRMPDSSNPKTRDIVVRYKFFFSSSGHNLPHDVSTGFPIHWEGRLFGIGALRQALDEENTGVVVESTSSITLLNGDGYFDDIFDTLTWENQECEFWSWVTTTPVSEAQKLFSGVISEKSFTPDSVTFRLNDFTFRLRDRVNLDFYDSTDGDLSDSDLNTPKRRIFGRVSKMACVGINKTLDGYTINTSATGSIDQDFIKFGSSQLGQLFPGDSIVITLPDGSEEEIGVDAINSPTEYALSGDLDFSFNAISFKIKPSRPTRARNRNWQIAGHELYEPQSEIVSVINGNRYQLDSIDGLYPGDRIEVNAEMGTVRRITDDVLVTNQFFSPVPIVGDIITRPALVEAYIGIEQMQYGRDYSYTNSGEAILHIDPLAEFNLAATRSINSTSLTFTNGSRSVTSSSASFDLRTILRPRDWVRSTSITHVTWYEVAQVDEFSLQLVSNFGGTTGLTTAQYKTVDYIGDDATILVDCYGLASDGEWVKTPADCVKYLLEFDAGLPQIDTAAFDKANAVCDYIVSLPLPARPGDGLPSIRDTISKINSSVFGSLFTTADFQLSYSILNSSKPASLVTLKDDDIISFSAETKNQICNEVLAKYRPFVDASTGEDTFEVYEFTSEFVNKTSGIKRLEEITLYLFEHEKAQMMAQRFAFFRSLSSSRIKLKAPLALANYSLGDKVYLSLDRLFKRYGGGNRLKIGVVAGVSRDGYSVELALNDLGNIINRVPSIAPNTQPDYSGSSAESIAMFGFITDNLTETPDPSTDGELGNNLIG